MEIHRDKLSILQANDHFRDWYSLDDKRVCALCGRNFTGHDVLIATVGDQDELRCPTAFCKSGVHQWAYPGNPLLSAKTYDDWWNAIGSTDELDGAGGQPSPQGV